MTATDTFQREPTEPPAGRYDWVDSLRLFAALAVFVQHVFEASSSARLQAVTEISPGVFGVVLFFLISGFVMPLSVRNHFNIAEFAIRRLLRIFPGVLVAFALLFFVQLVFLPDYPRAMWTADLKSWIANLLLINDYLGTRTFLAVTWTLSIEFAWYALFGLTWWWRKERSIEPLCWVATLGMLAITAISYLIDQRVPLGRLGMVYAAIIGAQSYRWMIGSIDRRRFFGWFAAFMLVMVLANLVAFGHFTHPDITLAESLWPWLIAPVIYVATLAVMRRRRSERRAGMTARLGKMSFSIYLLHPIAMAAVSGVDNEAVRIVATLAITLLASWAVFRWVELPGIAAGRHLSRWISRKRANSSEIREGAAW